MKEIDKYMSPSEAANRWGIPETTLKNFLHRGTPADTITLQEMIDLGHIKYYIKPEGKRKEWIISESAMQIWFPRKER